MILKKREAARINERVLDLARRLVRIRSLTGREDEVASFISGAFCKWGLEVDTVAGNNIVATLKGSVGHPKLLFCGHHDHVPEGDRAHWERPPFSGEIDGDKLHGRGAADAKGGLAAIMAAVQAIRESEVVLRGDLIVAAVREETVDLQERGVVKIIKAGLHCDHALVIEPTNLDIGLGHKGRITVKFTTKGQAAHSSMPWRGVNAIEHMAAIMSELNRLKLPDQPPLGAGTINIGRIEGGVSSSIVPEKCTLEVDRRITTGETPDSVLAQYRGIIDRLQKRLQDFQGHLEAVTAFFPSQISSEEKIVQTLLDAAGEVNAHQPELRYMHFHTDQEWLVNMAGIPSAIFGPGAPHMAHAANEFVPISQLRAAAKIYLHIIGKLIS